MPSFSLSDLTNFFLRCEIAVLNLEESHDRSSRLLGLVDRGVSILNSPAVQSMIKAKERRKLLLSQQQQQKEKEEVKTQQEQEDEAKTTAIVSEEEENNTTTPSKIHRTFSQQNVFASSSAKKSLLRSSTPCSSSLSPSKKVKENTNNDDEERNEKSILSKRFTAIVLGLDSSLAEEMFPSTTSDESISSSSSSLSKMINTFIPTEVSDQQFNEEIIQRRVFELKLAALRHSLNAFFDICSIAAVQTMTLPLIIPPLVSSSSFLKLTQVALVAFRPAVLFVSNFSTIAIEARSEQQKENEIAASSSSSDEVLNNASLLLLPHVDSIINGVCGIVSKALLPSGFLGPSILKAWWNHFVRKLQPSALLKELDAIEKEIWSFPTTTTTTSSSSTTTSSSSNYHNGIHANAAAVVLKLYPELPLLSAIALLMLPESEEPSSSSSMIKIEQEIQKQLLSRCVSLCNQGLSYAKELRESSTGWIVSRGSRCCVLALLIRSEVQRRMLRHTSALDDTKQAVAIDEGAKVFSGENISSKKCKVINSIVMEFAPALFPSFGNDMSHATLFVTTTKCGDENQNTSDSSSSAMMDFVPKNPFMIAHEALCERSKFQQNNNNNDNNQDKILRCFDLTTMLVSIQRAVATVKSNTSSSSDSLSSPKSSSSRNLLSSSVFNTLAKEQKSDEENFHASCAFCHQQHASSNKLAISSIHKAIGEILPIPQYLMENEEISDFLRQSSYLSTNSSNYHNDQQQLSPMSFLRQKQEAAKSNDIQNEEDEEEMDKKYLPPADFCLCPGLVERISWISQPVNRLAPSPFACLGKRFWGFTSCNGDQNPQQHLRSKIMAIKKNSNNNSSLPPLASSSNNTKNKNKTSEIPTMQRANTTIPIRTRTTSTSNNNNTNRRNSTGTLLRNGRPMSAASLNRRDQQQKELPMKRSSSSLGNRKEIPASNNNTIATRRKSTSSRSNTPVPEAVDRPITFAAFVKEHHQQTSDEEPKQKQVNPTPPTMSKSSSGTSTPITGGGLSRSNSNLSNTNSRFLKRKSSFTNNIAVSKETPIPKKESLVKSFFARAAAGGGGK